MVLSALRFAPQALRAETAWKALCFLGAALLVLAVPSAPSAARERAEPPEVRVFMQNADVLSGRLLRIGDAAIHLETSFAGTLTIPREAVARVEYGDVAWTQPIPPDLAPPEEPPVETEEDEDFAASVVDDERFFPFEAEGRIEVGVDFISGSRDRREFKIDTDTRLDFGEHRLDLEARIDRRRADGRTFVDRKRFEAVYDRFVDDRFYLSPLLRWRQDRVAGLDRRWTSALRLGYVVFDDPSRTLEILGGPLWQHERSTHAGQESTWAATWSIDYRHQLSRLSDRLSIFHEQDVSIDFDAEPGRSIVTADGGMRYKLSNNLFLTAVVEYDVDTQRNFKVDEWERTVGLNVGYQW